MAGPSASDSFYSFYIRHIGLCEHKGLEDYILHLCYFHRPEFAISLALVWL